ncbi:alpha/beta fold hydrolase [Marinicella sediminis]|uniref:Alpha/beta fold hydrolase n=1 Tax=Marinicella sediminis TaxID=1792834 RepID=A0ABV7JFG8_9GAMM|nr:alpha/beta hydrolase [Marinicella sediminis]
MKHRTFTLMAFLFTSLTALAGDFDFKVTVHGEGQPMLLIPGLSNAAEVWDSTVEQFKGQYEMHTVTLPGFAGQPPLQNTEGFLNQVRDQLLAYIDQHGWQQPVIVGHSLGGYVSMLMAIEQPNLFEKIIIVDAVPFIPALTMPGATEENSKAMANGMKAQMSSQSEQMRAASLDMILASMITNPEHIKLAKQWGMDSDPASVNQAMYEMMTRDIRDEIAVIQTPTLVMGSWVAYKIYGMSRERLQQSYGAQYAAMPDQRLAVTDTGKHFIMWDDPEFYFATMTDFLNQ